MLRFGTDGVRGNAEADLTPDLIVGLGRALGRVLAGTSLLVGRDTRASGPRIVSELTAGLAAERVAAVPLGVLPTPAIAFTAAREGVPAAIVSASHNRWSDNGVKVIGADGRKLPDEAEAAIEAELETELAASSSFVAFATRRDTRLADAQDSGELASLAASRPAHTTVAATGAARRVRRELAQRRRSLTSRAQASRAASLRIEIVGRVGFEPT